MHIPVDIFLYAFYNKLVLISLFPEKLYSLVVKIMLFRKLNAYKLRGILRPGQIIALKEGKQR